MIDPNVYRPSWVQQSIGWHRANGTLAQSESTMAMDSAFNEANGGTMRSHDQRPRGGVRSGRRLSRDQQNGSYTNGNGMPPRGGYQPYQMDQANAPPSAEECCQFVEMLLAGLQTADAENETDEHDRLMQMLAHLISEQHNESATDQTSTLPNAGSPRFNGRGGTDRRVAVRARDTRNMRRPAQDSALAALNTSSFLRRFPGAARIKFSANGRY
jgi:hypothetical protein